MFRLAEGPRPQKQSAPFLAALRLRLEDMLQMSSNGYVLSPSMLCSGLGSSRNLEKFHLWGELKSYTSKRHLENMVQYQYDGGPIFNYQITTYIHLYNIGNEFIYVY